MVGMPNGLSMSAAQRKEACRSGIAAAAAAGFVLLSTSGAQAAASDYPTPGQPVAPGESTEDLDPAATTAEKDEDDLRAATMNAELTGASTEEVLADLRDGLPEARTLAETVQINAPDVLVLTGVSSDEYGEIAETLNEEYLAVSQNGQEPLDYPHVFTAETNSGLDSGADLDDDGVIGGPGDAIGYGEYPGHYGTVIFSKHPIEEDQVRTFQEFLWDDMPENSMEEDDFSELERSILRLSTGTLWDVPIRVDGENIHLVASSVALPEDSQDVDPARGSDERRMVEDFISGDGWYLYDDEGQEGPLIPGNRFVLLGQPMSPHGLEDEADGLDSLLSSYVLQDTEPTAVTDQPVDERVGAEHGTDESATRAVPSGTDVRASYALPGAMLDVNGSGVFWPGEGEYGYELVDPESPDAPEDRLVWLDVGTL
ncbi:endonuclease [Nesterenkonia cremea]|uniref:Endonuclease n=2 Tax=Nesterenkonia cremea TaxID=1882340 RepID=A0A917ELH1_9MICC|nr:endonuclease [Nesterenkonia cremea]